MRATNAPRALALAASEGRAAMISVGQAWFRERLFLTGLFLLMMLPYTVAFRTRIRLRPVPSPNPSPFVYTMQ